MKRRRGWRLLRESLYGVRFISHAEYCWRLLARWIVSMTPIPHELTDAEIEAMIEAYHFEEE